MTKISISFTTDQATKTQLDRIAKKLGLSTSSLLNILVKQTVAANGIPFDVKAPNPRQLNQFDEETQTAIIKELAIEKGLLPDDSTVVADVEKYFEDNAIEKESAMDFSGHTLYVGHTPLPGPFFSSSFHVIDVDTGSFLPSGCITIMDMDTFEYWQSGKEGKRILPFRRD